MGSSPNNFADIGFMLVATEHRHYVDQCSHSSNTNDLNFRHESEYGAGMTLTYKTEGYGPSITLAGDYTFRWSECSSSLPHLLVEVPTAGVRTT